MKNLIVLGIQLLTSLQRARGGGVIRHSLLFVVASLFALSSADSDGFCFWNAAAYNHVFVRIQGSPFTEEVPPYFAEDFVREAALLNGTDLWNISARGVTASVHQVEPDDESCGLYSRYLHSTRQGIIYEFIGRPRSVTVRGMSNSSFSDDILLDGRGCPPAFGTLTTDSQSTSWRDTSVEFSLTRSTVVTIFHIIGSAYVARTSPSGYAGSGTTSGTWIQRVIDGAYLYSRSVTQGYPGGVQKVIDEVYLPAGRYILGHTVSSHVGANAWSSGNHSVYQISLSGGGGDSSLMRLYLGRLSPPEGMDAADLILADVNADGCIDDADLLEVLSQYGNSSGTADINQDGIVDDADLFIVLLLFGTCYLQ